jgi:hypothetical protein
MRSTLGIGIAVAWATLALAGCGQTKSQQAAVAAEPKGELITAVGCAAPGEAPGCVTITSSGVVYDISSASPAVDLNRRVTVSLRGRADGSKTTCGARLADIKYDYLSFQCAAPAEASAKAEEEGDPPA